MPGPSQVPSESITGTGNPVLVSTMMRPLASNFAS
jgi:hypothetical protein